MSKIRRTKRQKLRQVKKRVKTTKTKPAIKTMAKKEQVNSQNQTIKSPAVALESKEGFTLLAAPFRWLQQLELWGLWVLIFLIPTNLSLSLSRETAKVHGIIVDYLIPKFYLSDIVIGLILLSWLIRLLPRLPRLISHYSTYIPLALPLLLAALLASSLGSLNPTAAIWYLVKLVEFSLLGVWFLNTVSIKSDLTRPLFLSLFFQALIGLVQWLQKQSILGYLFLGETTLSSSAHVAKTTFQGELRPLPYGTTAHPNILGGFLVIGLIWLLLLREEQDESQLMMFARSFGTLIVLIFCLGTLALTQSISALLALALGLIFMRGQHFHKQNLLSLAGLIIGLALFFLPIMNPDSITRRLQLMEISSQMILANPLLGVGPNNFTATMSSYGEIAGATRFFQPVHNIFFLWLTEVGVIGTVLLGWLLFDMRKILTVSIRQRFKYWIPVFMLLAIGLLDHYPLSLQSGLLLFTFSLALPFSRATQD